MKFNQDRNRSTQDLIEGLRVDLQSQKEEFEDFKAEQLANYSVQLTWQSERSSVISDLSDEIRSLKELITCLQEVSVN
jgi:uncharacterized membrane-anchored protein YjiN (DUF445 family)